MINRELAEDLAAVTREYVTGIFSSLTDRIKALESRPEPRDGKDGRDGEKGEKGDPGRDVDPETLEYFRQSNITLLAEITALKFRIQELEARPIPKDGEKGEPGERGEKGDPGERGPEGPQGPPGLAGERGERGPQGEKGLDGASGPQGLQGPIGERGEMGPQGQKGEMGSIGPEGPQGPIGLTGDRGLTGSQGERGETGPIGPAGLNGKDGIGIAGALIDRNGHLILTMTDATTKDVGPVVAKDVDPEDVRRFVEAEVAKFPKPKDGKDGLDGLGFDDFQIEQRDERTFVLKFVSGERVKEAGAFTVPTLIYRDVFAEGKEYQEGDAVTWAGSLWIARTKTSNKPGVGESSGWRLAVKKGSEGPRGPKGEDGKPGPQGEKGEPGKTPKW